MQKVEQQKTKFLKILNSIRSKFQKYPASETTRTVSFRIFPNKEFQEKLNKWFDEISEVRYEHLHDIYERFKANEINIFKEKISYQNLYKGKKLFEGLRNQYKILNSKTEEGIRQDIEGILKSFVTNTKRKLNKNKSNEIRIKLLGKLDKLNKILEEISEDELKQKINELKKLYDKLLQSQYPFNNYQHWKDTASLIEEINKLIKEINKEINFLSTQNKVELKKLPKLIKLPRFPLVEKYESPKEFKNRFNLILFDNIKEDFKNKLFSLKKKYDVEKEKYLNAEKLNSSFKEKLEKYLSKKIDKFEKKLKYFKNKTKSKKRPFEYRLINWIKEKKPEIKTILEGLFERLEKEEKHLEKRLVDKNSVYSYSNTLLILIELVYISQKPEEDQNEIINQVNNEITTELKSLLNKGKSIKDVFTISGFSWSKSKPQKAGCLILKRENNKDKLGLVLSNSQSVYCFKEECHEHPNKEEFEFIVLKGGGSRKKETNPKQMEIKKGHLVLDEDKNKYACYFWLHHGKSYLRRFLFHSDWGFLGKKDNNNKFYPTNARIKRVKYKPKDDFEYYVDLSFQYYGDKTQDLDKIDFKYFIGIDRGERNPIAYAVFNKESGKIEEVGILGENLGKILGELNKKRKKVKKIRNKIKRTKETIIKQSISKILSLLDKYHPALIVLEDLEKEFGAEKSLIPKRTYNKVEKQIQDALELIGFKSGEPLIKKVDPKDTSIICPQCSFNFNEEIKNKILKKLKPEEFLKIINNLEEKDGFYYSPDLKIKIPTEWLYYDEKEKYPLSIKIENIKKSIEEEKIEEALNNFKKLTPRITQEQFICLKCGYEEKADIVGAINIAKRAVENIKNSK